MPKKSAANAIANTADHRITRSSPRTRKREPDPKTNGIDSHSSKRLKKGSPSENLEEAKSKSLAVDEEGPADKTGGRRQPRKIKKDNTAEPREAIKQETETDQEEEEELAVAKVETPVKKSPEAKRTRKPKQEHKKIGDEKEASKETKDMPLAPRTQGLRMFVGAHVSMAKGIQNSITNAEHIGGNAFALFLKSQRQWNNPPLSDESCQAFRSHLVTHKYDATSHVLPHGPYLVNLAQEDEAKAKQAYDSFLNDLQRCESLGIKLYNFHPGAAGPSPLPDALKRIANHLNTALASTTTVTPLLENMSGSGTVIGSRLTDLADIISQIRPEFRHRIGVCIDTCHAFAAGHDIRHPAGLASFLTSFDSTIGLDHLRALHLNDSKAPFASKRDLHQNIGLGFLGLRAFHAIMNEHRFENMPLILETPCDREVADDPDDDDDDDDNDDDEDDTDDSTTATKRKSSTKHQKPKPKPQPKSKPKKKTTIEDKSIWAREIKLLESLIGMDIESDEFRALEAELAEKGRVEREEMVRAVEGRKGKTAGGGGGRKKGQKSLVGMMMTKGGN